jgi:hypothetical protein
MKIRVILSNELEVVCPSGNSLRIPAGKEVEIFLDKENLEKFFNWVLSQSQPELILQAETEYCGQMYVIDVRFIPSTEPNQSHIVREDHSLPVVPFGADLPRIGIPPKVNGHHHVQSLLYLDGFRGDRPDLVGFGS